MNNDRLLTPRIGKTALRENYLCVRFGEEEENLLHVLLLGNDFCNKRSIYEQLSHNVMVFNSSIFFQEIIWSKFFQEIMDHKRSKRMSFA